MTTLEKKNAAFSALPPMKKRVAIAEDIRLQLRTKKFIAGSGYGHEKKAHYYGRDFPLGDLQQHLKAGSVCEGCAKAACIVSRAKLGNSIVVDEGTYNSDLAHATSAEIFGEECSNLIEEIYEMSNSYDRTDDENEAIDAYIERLPCREEDPRGRMDAIYKNIVTNSGHLVIRHKGKVYKY